MRRFGIPAADARGQLQRDDAELAVQKFEPLPHPTGSPPYRLALKDVIGTEPTGGLAFHVIGDHGGVKDPDPQRAVAAALAADHAQRPVAFCYSVGDVVYFNGAENEYANQFGEPYAHYAVPIFAIPGNHDGDPEEDGEASLDAFMRHFCDSAPRLLPDMAEFQRDTMDQPNCYWTLTSDHVTIIGLYSNVPSGGQIEPDQAAWLVSELRDAPTNRPVIVALHHPPYSVDAHHGGSAKMGKVLDGAFEEAERCPDLVLAGHVHDAQFFVREAWGKQIGYVVIGNSGYHNLHAFAKGAQEGDELDQGVTFQYGDDGGWGFLRVEVLNEDGINNVLRVEYIGVAKDGTVSPEKHVYSSAAARGV
jgi:Icc-related predicted phosphoesterase